MLLELADLLSGWYRGFHLFQYLTFRAIMSTLTALTVSLLFGPLIIRKLADLKAGQVVRNDGPQSHLTKAGTPTMGGLLILFAPRLMIVGMSNAVNLTDGLDGLAIMPAVMVAAGLGHLRLPRRHMRVRQLPAFPSSPAPANWPSSAARWPGAGLGFLWFNTYPAQVFMGDVGALALGARWEPSP
jgi:UDP-N-acetylmuramyl pentapeptide phosphotransferase/UDP-N-acetylglucosamine-1-phosphate transferase